MKKFSSLRVKIILIFITSAIVPILLVSLFSYTITFNAMNTIEEVLADYALMQSSENIKDKMDNYKNNITRIATDTQIITLINEFESTQPSSRQSAFARNSLLNQFLFYMRTDKYIASIAFITNTLEIVVADHYDQSLYFPLRWENEEYLKSFKAYGGEFNRNKVNVIQSVNFPGAPLNSEQNIYFVFPVIDFITNKDYGIIVMEINNTVFNSIINGSNQSNLFDDYISHSSCITDANGLIITSSNTEIIGFNLDEVANDIRSSIINLPINGTSLNLNLIFEKSVLQGYIDKFRNLVIILTLGLTICFLVVVFALTGRLWEKVSKITTAINQFRQNQKEVVVDIDESDEILYAIADQFNKMASEITSLVGQLEEKNKDIAIVMDHRRKAEIIAMQAQINPHFIYNALDRINWMAIDDDQHEISAMLSGLGSLLRYSVSNIDILVPLSAEISWMEKYILIQSKRFDKTIDYVYHAHGDAINFPLYKMLLQPLVENSILHGLVSNNLASGRIELSAVILSDMRLKIMLSDNGCGIEEDVLTNIRRLIAQKDDEPPDGIGINNVVKRLWLYYGDEAEIYVDSSKDTGTTFTLYIPYRE